MSALASLAAYGDDDDEPEVEQSQPAKEGDASSSCPAAEPTLGANGAQPAPASSNPPPPDMSDTAPPPAARPFAGPSSPIAPSRTPSSRTSSLAHLLPPPPLAHTETNPAIEAKIQTFFGALERGHSVSAQLRSSKRFNNPDILEKLVSFFELDEIGSNYDPQVFDPRAPFLHAEDYKALAERQAGGTAPARTAVDFVSSAKGKEGEAKAAVSTANAGAAPVGDKTKRSKWDIPAEEEAPPPPKVAKPAAPAPKQVAQEKSAYRQYLEKRKADGK